MRYENHMLENEPLPFIFHYDIITKRGMQEFGEFANWHENTEFLYFTKGKGNLLYNKCNYSVEEGMLAIVNSDCFHAFSTEDTLEYYCLIVDDKFFRENGIPIDSITFKPIIVNFGFGEKFAKIDELYEGDSIYRCAKIRAEVLDLMIYFAENYKTAEMLKENFPKSIKDAITYIKKHYSEDISIEDIVGHVGFSRAYFSREFKKSTGVSLVTYLNYIRCRQAQTFLGTGDMTVGETAEMCGFRNFSYFSKTYRRVMGLLPSKDLDCFNRGREDSEVFHGMRISTNDKEIYSQNV